MGRAGGWRLASSYEGGSIQTDQTGFCHEDKNRNVDKSKFEMCVNKNNVSLYPDIFDLVQSCFPDKTPKGH